LSRAQTDRINAEYLRLHPAQQSIRRMADAAGRQISEDRPSVVEQRAIIAAARSEIARLEKVRDERTESSQTIGRIVDATEEWLLDAARNGLAFEAVDVDVGLKQGEAPAVALERAQRCPWMHDGETSPPTAGEW
jgi:hypothetical protein